MSARFHSYHALVWAVAGPILCWEFMLKSRPAGCLRLASWGDRRAGTPDANVFRLERVVAGLAARVNRSWLGRLVDPSSHSAAKGIV
eukprot:6176774-Pleurochrysis_carterae.AAC.3